MRGEQLRQYMKKCFPTTHHQDGYLFRTYLTSNGKIIRELTYDKQPHKERES